MRAAPISSRTCEPPSPTGYDCARTCTGGLLPDGYEMAPNFDACPSFATCGETAEDVSSRTDWTIIMPDENRGIKHPSTAACLGVCGGESVRYRFQVGSGKCLRVTTPDTTTRSFSESALNCGTLRGCIVAEGGPDGVKVYTAPEALSTWLRVEVADSAGGCPLECP
jgi:hypothetical protein